MTILEPIFPIKCFVKHPRDDHCVYVCLYLHVLSPPFYQNHWNHWRYHLPLYLPFHCLEIHGQKSPTQLDVGIQLDFFQANCPAGDWGWLGCRRHRRTSDDRPGVVAPRSSCGGKRTGTWEKQVVPVQDFPKARCGIVMFNTI